MTEDFFTSPLIWAMFALGLVGGFVACDNWLARFFFAWSMVFTYLFVWFIFTLAGFLILCGLGVDDASAKTLAGTFTAIGLVVLYGFQIYVMRGRISGISGGGGRSAGSGNPFRRNFSQP